MVTTETFSKVLTVYEAAKIISWNSQQLIYLIFNLFFLHFTCQRDEDGMQDMQEDRILDPEAAEGGAETVSSDVNDTAMAPKETVYSNIDFSAMKERNSAEGEKLPKTTETEYAEIKKGETKERQEDDGEEGEMLEGSAEKEEIKEEDEEVKWGLLTEEVVGEDVP